MCAAERVKWLMHDRNRRRVLAFAAESNDQSRLRRYVDDHMAFNELERRGHGVYGVMQWCQQALEETGNDKRVFPRGRMAAFLMHHLHEMPLERFQRSMTSTLTTRKAVMDLLQLFQLLESEGVSPSAYISNAMSAEDPKQIELAQAYGTYRQLLTKHRVTSWDGMVLDALEHTSTNATHSHSDEFMDAVLHGYTDVVVDDLHAMTPAMVKLLGNLCAHPSIQSSVSFSRVLLHGDECPRAVLLDKVLREEHALRLESVVLRDEQMWEDSRAREIRAIAQQVLGPHSKKAPATESTPLVKCFTFDTAANEELAIGKWIQDRLVSTPAQEIAVLCPTYIDAQRLGQSLQRQGIAVNGHASATSIGNHLFDEV